LHWPRCDRRTQVACQQRHGDITGIYGLA
jgi:hypothetical protein